MVRNVPSVMCLCVLYFVQMINCLYVNRKALEAYGVELAAEFVCFVGTPKAATIWL